MNVGRKFVDSTAIVNVQLVGKKTNANILKIEFVVIVGEVDKGDELVDVIGGQGVSVEIGQIVMEDGIGMRGDGHSGEGLPGAGQLGGHEVRSTGKDYSVRFDCSVLGEDKLDVQRMLDFCSWFHHYCFLFLLEVEHCRKRLKLRVLRDNLGQRQVCLPWIIFLFTSLGVAPVVRRGGCPGNEKS